MSTKLLVLVSMICHLATYLLLGLGSIYEMQILTFGSLCTLAIGLYFGKEVLERLDTAEIDDSDEDPPLGIG